MKRLVFLLICACLLGAVSPPSQVVPIPGADPWRTRPLILWGNYLWPDSPAAHPVFRANDFLNPGTKFVDRKSLLTTNRARAYEFAARDGARQVMWLPDSLGPPTFTVNGFPWQLTPSANTAVQTLKIHSYPGKVFFTSEQNSGGHSNATRDPIIIQ